MTRLVLLVLIALFNYTFQPAESSARPRPGKDLALFFVVNDYINDKGNGAWRDLNGPVHDAEGIAKDLRELYGFETEIVPNPTLDQILQKLAEYRNRTFTPDAQLLIFFSGHGHYMDELGEGFFVPRDGKRTNEDPSQSSWLSLIRLRRQVNYLPCPHILLAIDACYSGTIDDKVVMKDSSSVEDLSRPGENAENRNLFISDLLRSKSRIYCTSGAKQRTPDPSRFAAQFKNALRNLGGHDGILSIRELEEDYLSQALPRPLVGTFEGNEDGGKFLFIYKQYSPGQTSQPVSTDIDQDGVPNIQDYCPEIPGLARYQGCSGPHQMAEAARQILRLETEPTTDMFRHAMQDFAFNGQTYTSESEAKQMLQWLGIQGLPQSFQMSDHAQVWGMLPTGNEVRIWTTTYPGDGPDCYGIRFQTRSIRAYIQTNETYFPFCKPKAGPRPKALFTSTNTTGCGSVLSHFENESLNANQFIWLFSDGNSSLEFSPNHVFATPGVYSVTLIASQDGRFADTLTIKNAIHLVDPPVANFSFAESNTEQPGTFQFSNRSSNSKKFIWDFGDGDNSAEQNPAHRYFSNGPKVVSLVATGETGCTDTIVRIVTPKPMYWLTLPVKFNPSAKTPNERVFQPDGMGLKEFEIQVYDRWGNICWRSSALQEGRTVEHWDGTFKGKPMPEGIYSWHVNRAVFEDGTLWEGLKKGTVTLIREK